MVILVPLCPLLAKEGTGVVIKFNSILQESPSPQPSPTRGEGTFPLLMGGIKGR